MKTYGDTFEEAADTALTAHTPTGPDAGPGWTASAGAALVRATQDYLVDNNQLSGNRHCFSQPFDSGIVFATFDIDFEGTPVVTDGLFCGIQLRAQAVNAAGYLDIIGYEWTVGGWQISTPLGGIINTDTWPGVGTSVQVTATRDYCKMVVGGVEKAILFGNLGRGGRFHGVSPGNFENNATKRCVIDSLRITSLDEETARPRIKVLEAAMADEGEGIFSKMDVRDWW